MWNVARREIKSYFCLPLGYIYLCVFWVLGSGFFYYYNIQAGTSDVSVLFGNLSYLLMLVVPLLTMRLLSEEKRQKTDQLLFCTPTSTAMAVFGKYMAALMMLMLSMLGILVHVMILGTLVHIPAGTAFACFLGFFLLGSAYAAVGLLMSAIAENQLTAAVLTLCAFMLLQLCEMTADTVVVPYLGFVKHIMGAFKLNSSFYRFTTGIFSPLDIMYFILFDGAAVTLSVCVMKSRRLAGR